MEICICELQGARSSFPFEDILGIAKTLPKHSIAFIERTVVLSQRDKVPKFIDLRLTPMTQLNGNVPERPIETDPSDSKMDTDSDIDTENAIEMLSPESNIYKYINIFN